MNKNKVKQSVIVAALTSSFGIFISKALGLLYYAPLSALAGESNMAFYSITYTYYDLLLKISSAGIPFAIAALVARYYIRQDYKTVLLVKKLGISLIMGLSFIVALIFLFASKPLAMQAMGGASASESDVYHLRNLFLILVIAVILVPYLSAIRGYYQGLKRLDLYGSSQALEQFVRVLSIIVLALLFVKVFKFESIYAIYCAIAAAAIAALVTIIFFIFMTKADNKHIDELVKTQDSPVELKSVIIKEIIALGLPYLLISFLGSISPLINANFFLNTISKTNVDIESAKLSMGILLANCNKLHSIPQVLTIGFSAGLVPYLVETLEQQDINKLGKQVVQIIDTVLYILIPIIIIFIFFAKDIYFIMYGNTNLELGTNLFRLSNLVAFSDTIAPIISSIMITLRLRKEAVLTLIGSIMIKFISFFFLVKHFGANGMTFSSLLSSLFVIGAYLLILKKRFGIRFVQSLKRGVVIFVCALIACVPCIIADYFIPFEYSSRLLDILKMGGIGIVFISLYYLISAKINLPQHIFGIEKISPKSLLSKFRS